MTRFRQNPDFPATILGGEAAIVTPVDSRLHVLNGVATRVWELCEGEGIEFAELLSALLDEFDVAEADAASETREFLADGVRRGFILED